MSSKVEDYMRKDDKVENNSGFLVDKTSKEVEVS